MAKTPAVINILDFGSGHIWAFPGHLTSLEQALSKPSLKSAGSLRKQDELASAAFADVPLELATHRVSMAPHLSFTLRVGTGDTPL